MNTLAFSAFLVWCSIVARSDLRTHRLPNPLTAGGALTAFGYALGSGRFGAAVAGALLLSLPYLGVHLLCPHGLGAGDVKLAVGLGAITGLDGAQAWLWSACAAPVLTAGAGIPLLIRHHLGHRRRRRCGERARSPGLPESDSPGAASSGAASSGIGQPPGRRIPHGPSMCAAAVLGLLLW